MGWAGCYVLDLQCDYQKPLLGTHSNSTGREQFTGETGAEAKTAARQAGWLVGKTHRRKDGSVVGGYAVCPKCAIKERSH